MATAQAAPRPQDRHTRRRPFAQWMKRLANLKSSSTESPQTSSKKTRNLYLSPSQSKKPARNNPYPESGYVQELTPTINCHPSFSTAASGHQGSTASIHEPGSLRPPAFSTKSAAPTLVTIPDTVHSDAGQSKAGTSNTVGANSGSNEGGENSVFSSPNHSERSLTTTLTTIQSNAPSALLAPNQYGGTTSQTGYLHQGQASYGNTHFSHQYPVTPASAVPAHLAPHGHPTTYSSATANNLLTDNASILTLASSSKRRRRRSLDTDASVRALAPSSVWGGSRESLPLSVLSGNVEYTAPGASSGIYQPQSRPSIGGFASAERASLYSASGVTAPALSSERNSYYAAKQTDGASLRNGLQGHGRNDSTTNSIGGLGGASSLLASTREQYTPAPVSRGCSDFWRNGTEPDNWGHQDSGHRRAK